MKEIIGVRFRQAGKVYYFSPGKHKLKRGEFVIVETAKGVEIGTDRKSTRLNSSHDRQPRMPSSA